MFAKAVVKQGRTFDGFDGDVLAAVVALQIVTGSQGSGRTGSRDKGAEPGLGVFLMESIKHFCNGPPGALVMNQIISKLAELVEDDVVWVPVELRTFVVDLFDVAFGAVGANDVCRVFDPRLEPFETLTTHPLR